MRREVATMVLAVTCSTLLCAGPLLAKPTRTLTRPAARRMIIAQPVHRSSRERDLRATGSTPIRRREGAAAIRSVRLAATHTTTTVRPASRHASVAQPATLHSRRRTLSKERASAARAAIAADTNASTPSDSFSRQLARRESSLSTDEGTTSSAAAFTNVGGALRPASGLPPLKSIEEEAMAPGLLSPLRLSSLYDSQGRLIMPHPLYGSREILLHQNEMADRDGLNRIQDDADLLELRQQKKLVALPESEALRADYRLPEDRRYTRPWTAAFLSVVAADFYATFHMPLQVDSAVRTIAVQQHLLRINGNAAPTSGETASPHLTGQAVDIAKSGLSRTQIAWLRTYLQPLIDLGKIDVEEEFQQSCFHISVYRDFLSVAPEHVSIAAARQPAADTIAQRPSY